MMRVVAMSMALAGAHASCGDHNAACVASPLKAATLLQKSTQSQRGSSSGISDGTFDATRFEDRDAADAGMQTSPRVFDGSTDSFKEITKGRSPKIATYVINLESRKDRMTCMTAQLASAPQPVYRQPAVGMDACSLDSDVATLYGSHNHVNEQSLFCSNYKIWNRARDGEADFIVILEDDIILKPNFWELIHDFAKSCPAFDYVAIDSWKSEGNSEQDRVMTCASAGFQNLWRADPQSDLKYGGYWGTQVQLIRKAFLSTLIQRAHHYGMGPLDVWWMMRVNDGRSFSWQPQIGLQFSQMSTAHARRAYADRNVSGHCSESVRPSDIAGNASGTAPVRPS